MTALIATGGEGPSPDSLRFLLEDCDLIVAADSGLDMLAAAGIGPHLFVGDGDSLAPALVEMAKAAGWIPMSQDKDYSDTELAVMACEERGAGIIHLVGGGGRRLDHLLSNLQLFRKYERLKTWSTAWESARVLEPGEFRTTHRSNALLSVYPLNPGGGRICTRGLKWELDRVDFRQAMSLSNRAAGTDVFWTVEEGRFLLMEIHG